MHDWREIWVIRIRCCANVQTETTRLLSSRTGVDALNPTGTSRPNAWTPKLDTDLSHKENCQNVWWTRVKLGLLSTPNMYLPWKAIPQSTIRGVGRKKSPPSMSTVVYWDVLVYWFTHPFWLFSHFETTLEFGVPDFETIPSPFHHMLAFFTNICHNLTKLMSPDAIYHGI